ncbi:lactate dehydrogenase [Streptomyces sp. MUSC 14]|uniref:lactate/malate family dehydrogenase n=1 Tax=Streptomyces sp. MUSC 14 TaxID=1354889 RepID=UPI0009A0AF12|nr:lactate dehydrogenase [Streptomyces sp. MUSC 14]
MTPQGACVGMVGAGAVGQAVGTALMSAGLCGRLLIVSRTVEQAAALVADLDDMRTAIGSPVVTYAVEVPRLWDCDAVVIAARAQFTNTRSSEVRMGGAQVNTPVVARLARKLSHYPGTVLMVTNPVDLMTRLFAEQSGCPRVFGIGSNLDTARYRHTLARLMAVPVGAVRGHVIGEHGDNAVVCASSTTVHGRPIAVPIERIREEITLRPGRISAGIGRTRSGPAGAVVSALRLTLGLDDGLTELSTLYRGGCLGVPLRFSAGLARPCMPSLDGAEQRQLLLARDKLHTAYQAVCEVLSHPSSSVRNP